MKKNDILLLVVYIAMTVAMTVYVLADKINAQADQIVVYSDGEVVKSISWPAENQDFEVENEHGHINVHIENGIVDVSESNCRDQVCVQTKSIQRGGEMIVCLPNKMYVEIKKKETSESDVDVISQ